jgi:hypothetical protein
VNLTQLVAYVRAHGDGVVSTVGPNGAPQGAYVAVAATEGGELVFNARSTSRKVENVRRDARAALTIGGGDGTTLQCQGIAELLEGGELARCADAYYTTFPQFARSTAGDIAFVRVRLEWARFGQYVGGVFESNDVGLTS